MMDILIIEDPSKKNIRNMYLNNYNYFHKNNIKMRHKKKHIINKHIKEKEFDRLTHPMPKMLYSTSSSFNFTAKRIEDKLQQAKPIIDDLINLVDNFSISLSSDNESKKDDFFMDRPFPRSGTLQRSAARTFRSIRSARNFRVMPASFWKQSTATNAASGPTFRTRLASMESSLLRKG